MSTVVITGASQGIGAGIAKAYMAAGHKVIVNARKRSPFCDELGESGKFVEGDARNRGTHRKLAEAAMEWTGSLDVYINNVGVSWWKPLEEIDEEFLEKMIQTNLYSAFWGSQAAASKMKRGASIINISSLAGKRGSANNSAYCAAKFGVNGLTQSLAKELGHRGIRVNSICPVYVQTDNLIEALEVNPSPAGGQNVQEYFKGFADSQAALKRLPLAEEVASSCLFLSSEAASAVTAQCINVDCGVMPS